MSQIGIFYGPELGSVEKVARVIESKFGADKVELIAVKNCNETDLSRFDKLIFGVSTVGMTNWDSDHKDNDWDVFATLFNKVDWTGKKVAIYGLGDHIQYPQHFVDAIGWIYDRLSALKVEVVGFCSTDGYTYEESEGIKDGQFLGLPVDEDSEPEKTDNRVENWINRLINEFGY